MRYMTLSAFSLGVLIGFSAFCESLEVGMYLPWNAIQANINSSEKHKLIGTLENVQLTSEFGAIAIPAIEAQANFLLKMQKQANLITKISSDKLQLQIRVPSFDISKQVVKQIGSAQVIVNLTARCDDIVLQNSNIKILGDLKLSATATEVQAVVHVGELAWELNSWQVQKIHCQGPIGFADLLEAQISNQLASAMSFRAPLQQYIEKYLNLYFQQSLDSAMSPSLVSLPNSQYSYSLDHIDSLDDSGIRFVIKLSDNHGTSADAFEKFKFSDFQYLLSDTEPSLLVTKSAYENMIRKVLANEKLKTDLNSISGFASLLRSRFLQFFIWPDLMRWPKSSHFEMLSAGHMSSDLKYDAKAKNFKADFQISSTVSGMKDARVWEYLDLKTSIAVKFDLHITDGHLQLSPLQSKMNSVYSFGADYNQKYHPRKYIAASLITEAARNEFFSKAVNLTLPMIKLGTDFNFIPSAMQKTSAGDLVISFSKH